MLARAETRREVGVRPPATSYLSEPIDLEKQIKVNIIEKKQTVDSKLGTDMQEVTSRVKRSPSIISISSTNSHEG